jgi:hypothetical protein
MPTMAVIASQSFLVWAMLQEGKLAVILDEFSGQLSDYHGKLMQEYNAERMNLLLGMDLLRMGFRWVTLGHQTGQSMHLPNMDTLVQAAPYLTKMENVSRIMMWQLILITGSTSLKSDFTVHLCSTVRMATIF